MIRPISLCSSGSPEPTMVIQSMAFGSLCASAAATSASSASVGTYWARALVSGTLRPSWQ
jgi:hypothetical protein